MTHARSWLVAAGFGTLALLAGCSSSGGQSDSNDQGGGNATVAVRDVSGTGQVLTDDNGRTLYSSDQEKAAGKILCSSSDCLAIWTPLTLSSSEQVTAPSGMSGDLSTVKRPDGSRQVALDGLPLYTFSFDHSAGEVNGDGTKDSFDGTDFTWHAATANGAATTPSSTPSSSDDDGYVY